MPFDADQLSVANLPARVFLMRARMFGDAAFGAFTYGEFDLQEVTYNVGRTGDR